MYKEITVTTTAEHSEFVSDAFWSLGASGVSISDPGDLSEVLNGAANWDYVDAGLISSDDTVRVTGFIESENVEDTVTKLKDMLSLTLGSDAEEMRIEVKDVEDADWENDWKNYYKPVEAGHFVVLPEWMESAGYKDLLIVRINPATAFGTGAHESTQLCLRLMSELDLAGKRVLDVGTGSGILAIAAAKAGAEEVYATDIDPEAVRAVYENAELNGIERGITAACADLAGDLDVRADVVTANLTADILARLSAGVRANLVGGGILVCSGIIDQRKDEVVKLYEKLGFRTEREENLGEWWGLTLRLVGDVK